jgi:hypothetical protein
LRCSIKKWQFFDTFLRLIREMGRSKPKVLPLQQASGPPIARRLAATPALGEGDADAAGNGL